MEMFTKSVEKVDFSDAEARRQEINALVEEVTRNHIKDLLPERSITPDTASVLANAAFFKGLWKTKFATLSNGDYLNVISKFNVGGLEEVNADYVELPYKTDDNSSLSMFIYLPREKSPTAVDDLLSKMSSETISQALRGQNRTAVYLTLPKMNLDGKYELLDVS